MEDKNEFFSNIIAQERFLRFKETLEKEQFDFSLKNNLILKFLLEAKKDYERNSFIFYYNYFDVLVSYDRIIKNFSTLKSKLELNDALDISILFSYLLWNGYFSSEKKLHYCSSKNLNKIGFLGLEVMEGQGCCLHFSALLKDFLRACGYDSAILLNHLEKVDYTHIYFPNIQRKKENISKDKPFLSKTFTKLCVYVMGDHAFNLINDSGNLSIYDATNLLYVPISDCTDGRIVGKFVHGKLYPNFSYIFNLEKEAIQTLDLFHIGERGSYFDWIEYERKSEELLKRFGNNQDLLLSSYQDSCDDISIVSNGVKKFKKLVR